MKGPWGRLRRRWVRLAHSRYLVPGVALLFLAVFALAAVIVLWNARTVRGQLEAEYGRQQVRVVSQAAERVDWAFRSILSEVESLERQSRDATMQTLEPAMREALDRLRPFGVTQIGRIDARALPFLVYEVGAAGPPVKMTVRSPKDIDKVAEFADSSGRSHLWMNIGAGFRKTTARPVHIYARVNVTGLLKVALAEADPGNGGFFIAEVDGHLRPLRKHVTATDSGLDTAKTLATTDSQGETIRIEKAMPALLEPLRSGGRGYAKFNDIPEILPEARGRVFVAYTPLPAGPLPAGKLGTLVHVSSADAIVVDVESVYRRQYLILGGLLLAMFLAGLALAIYQQRTSRRLKHLVGEQDQILASILTNSVDGIIVFDNEEKIQMWNRGAQLIFGYTPEEMLGQSFRRLIAPDMDPEQEIARINAIIAEHGYLRNYVAPRVRKDGTRIIVDISRTPYYSKDGEYVGNTAVIKDITDKIEFDQKMYTTEKLASIGLLASGVAHEINNPLTIILGFADLLKDRFDESSPEYQDLLKIEANAEQAKKIVEDLLSFARTRQDVQAQADVRESVLKLLDFMRGTRLAKRVEFSTDIADDLPAVNGDPRELQQVLLNLINNSIAAIGDRSGIIQIQARQADGWVEINVEDNGRGIPIEIQPMIFDPFFTTREAGEGTGLGLSLSYGLVHKWGGEIRFTSRIPEGPREHGSTTFTLRIPTFDPEFNPETAS